MIAGLAALAGLMLSPPGATVTDLSIVSAAHRTELLIAVDGEVEVRHFIMEGPHRLVVDLLGARHGLAKEQYAHLDRGGILSLRTSQFTDDVVRVVAELASSLEYLVSQGPGYVRVSLPNASGDFEPWSAGGQDTYQEAPVRGEERGGPRAAATIPLAQQAPRITVSFSDTPIEQVLFTFAEFSGRSIVPGSQVEDIEVSADIRDQPWDVALQTILDSRGLAARELESGIIRVDNLENLTRMEQVEQVVTRPFRINYATAEEVQEPARALLSERGRVSVGVGTNTLIVTDIPRVLQSVASLIEELDVRTPQVTIAAKIIFVNRTDLDEFGVTYDLKDSQGNQLNLLTPGGIDLDGDGVIEPPDEQVDVGTDVISLGGNSIAALGNANNRVTGPTVSVLTSLLMGRYTLVAFIEALESVQMSDVQAAPHLTVLDNQSAKVLVGERTPLRVIDAQSSVAGAGGEGRSIAVPQATVELQETGIVLEVTPHVTAGNNILMSIRAERSAAELASSDAGFIFRTQEAESRVLVEDGETVVIAGLTVTEKTESRSGIPFLMDIPLLGPLFRVDRTSQIQRDLMILVTPYIVRD